MKKLKGMLSLLLALSLVMTVMPRLSDARALEVVQRYELDTDGIETDGVYLIVSADSGSANALRRSNTSVAGQSVTVETDRDGTPYISIGFSNENNCKFSFGGTDSGKVTNTNGSTNYTLNINTNSYGTAVQFSRNGSQTCAFEDMGDGAYRISRSSSSRKYYLSYNNGWTRSSNNTPATVYLFKLTDHVVGCDVTYNGNGHTEGTLPANSEQVSVGDTYTVAAPTDLRRDVGEDSWLFYSWNTKADGTGDEYFPGDTFTVNDSVTLYAQWTPVIKFEVAMITYLNGVPTDVDQISGTDKQFYVQLEGDGSYIPLSKTAVGTYTAKVEQNGTYVVYATTDGGAYEAVHGHKVVIFGQDGSTECMHYSLSYDAAGGVWAEGEDPGVSVGHLGETFTVTDKVPSLKGNRFLGWVDQEGNTYAPGATITTAIDRQVVLTAQWEKTVDVTVNITINHKAPTGGQDNSDAKDDVVFQVMYTDENGNNHLVGEVTLTPDNHGNYEYNSANGITTYTMVDGAVTLAALEKGTYSVSLAKRQYELVVTSATDKDGNVTLSVELTYAPTNFDLDFDVVVDDWAKVPTHLRPTAVNVKVLYWGYDADDVLGWHVITQQGGDNAPVAVMIDSATGTGSGFFPVWKNWSTDDVSDPPYFYRVEVVSYVMADGTVVAAATDDIVNYAGGVYTGRVSIRPAGGLPDYPDHSETTLQGTRYDEDLQEQDSIPTINVKVKPFTVTFVAGNGTVNGQQTLVLSGQYGYPNLNDYVGVPADDRTFLGWLDENGEPAVNMAGQLLSGNVTYTALYKENITLSGTVQVDATYQQGDDTIFVNEIDRVSKVQVVLQKKMGDAYNDVASCFVTITYANNADHGVGHYAFADLPDDGTQYRVTVLVLNYDADYDNNNDGNFADTEADALVDVQTNQAQVDAHLVFAPASYQQIVNVDSSQIHKDLRPTGAVVQILYRDLGGNHVYNVITQHTVDPYGIPITMTGAWGEGSDGVWNWHTDGTLYEYQAQVYMLYGKNVEGAYTQEGTPVIGNSDLPYTIKYGAAHNYAIYSTTGGASLMATLVPKEYAVMLDLNLGDDLDAPVYGLEQFMMDDGKGGEYYAYMHTWSYADEFIASPYREGYVFKGWEVSSNEHEVYITDTGKMHVGATLSQQVTLTAKWEKLEGTDYTIRHLELNTDQVLKGATAVDGDGVMVSSSIKAVDNVAKIEGYVYAGAMVGGVYYDKSYNPELIISNNPLDNLMIIYYLPDGSDGYTEQVESNLNINKTAILENNGTYTITMDTFTKNNPITTRIQQNTPMDIVLVLDQSASMYNLYWPEQSALHDLKAAVSNFVDLIADHGRENQVDHRIAMVGFASNGDYSGFTTGYPSANGNNGLWCNTGVYDSNGVFHNYKATGEVGFAYTAYTGSIVKTGTYYTYVNGEYLLLTYHDLYRHLITAEEARVAALQGEKVYGYVAGEGKDGYVELTRNSSGLWLYDGENKKLYSKTEFFTFHSDVWTHRAGLDAREIHAYGEGNEYIAVDGHTGIFTRKETVVEAGSANSIYRDALVPVTTGANGAGGVTPGLMTAIDNIGANGKTYVSYGMKMANSILEANPVDAKEGRIRFVVVFTDGKPGDSSNFDEVESNNALKEAYIAEHTYGADVYTVGLYGSDMANLDPESDQGFFMEGLSSNYPNAQSMDDVWQRAEYGYPQDGFTLDNGGYYYVKDGNNYYELTRQNVYVGKVNGQYAYNYTWGYTNASGQRVNIHEQQIIPTAQVYTAPAIQNHQVNGYDIYRRYGEGYQERAEGADYYYLAENAADLRNHFADIVAKITTKVTTEIILDEGTILRDIMNQGLVLTDGTVITAYLQEGNYNAQTGQIIWKVDANGNPVLDQKVSLTVGQQSSAKDNVSGIEIIVYNYGAANATDPTAEGYQPHTVDVTGYNYHDWYINETKTTGYKMVVTITRVEARDDVEWGRSTNTNNEQSGLWLPEDDKGNRELLLPFEQPTTIFVERAYVLDYGKAFTLSGWYFDDEDGKDATPIHLDLDIASGMNWFDENNPNVINAINGAYGNTKYGNVRIEDGQVIYSPTTMSWGGYDQFYVFGNTWRKTVQAQDANENGNLWNKVTIIPANNVYYEDSFITTGSSTQNGIEGFAFGEGWQIVGSDDAGNNTEKPEHQETPPYGDVHGWTDHLNDDLNFTDGSAHGTGLDGQTVGATATFTFTGTGAEVYTRTNAESGMVVAILTDAANGTTVKSIAVDNLAVSGDYYHIPTVAFKDLAYGTYTVTLIATSAEVAVEGVRYEYYIDGVRIYNPLGTTTNYQDDVVKDAYGLEVNAVFTEVRDILLDYGDFNVDMEDDDQGKAGAVFIDWIQPGQESGNDHAGKGVPSYEIGTFESYGPKNEVYLSAGQAIVLKVREDNFYFVGLKSLKGQEVTVNVSGIDQADPTEIQLSHTTDLYYRVTPVDGYIVIQNGSDGDEILSITNLRTTNLTAPVEDGGIIPVVREEVIEVMEEFTEYLLNRPEPEEPQIPETLPSVEEQLEANRQMTEALFADVRTWLETA